LRPVRLVMYLIIPFVLILEPLVLVLVLVLAC